MILVTFIDGNEIGGKPVCIIMKIMKKYYILMGKCLLKYFFVIRYRSWCRLSVNQLPIMIYWGLFLLFLIGILSGFFIYSMVKKSLTRHYLFPFFHV